MNILESRLKIKPQQGAVLITSLILLFVLTLLGLSSMGTVTLEERMAANTQTINRSFQAASTGLEFVVNDEAAFNSRLTAENDTDPAKDLYANKHNNDIGGSSANAYNAVTTYNSVFIQQTEPGRGTGTNIWDKGKFAFYHFDLSATGCIATNNSDTDCSNGISPTILHQGFYQVGNKGS